MEFIGFMAVLLLGGVVVRSVGFALNNPAVVQKISGFSPWLGDNAQALSWVAMALLTSAVLMVPLILKVRAVETEKNGMEAIGAGIWFSAKVGIICMAIISIGYLAGIGWLAATVK